MERRLSTVTSELIKLSKKIEGTFKHVKSPRDETFAETLKQIRIEIGRIDILFHALVNLQTVVKLRIATLKRLDKKVKEHDEVINKLLKALNNHNNK